MTLAGRYFAVRIRAGRTCTAPGRCEEFLPKSLVEEAAPAPLWETECPHVLSDRIFVVTDFLRDASDRRMRCELGDTALPPRDLVLPDVRLNGAEDRIDIDAENHS